MCEPTKCTISDLDEDSEIIKTLTELTNYYKTTKINEP